MKPIMKDIFSRSLDEGGEHLDLVKAAPPNKNEPPPVEENAYGKPTRKPRRRKGG
jgi:hypothetical protein